METHQGRLIRTWGSAIVICYKVPRLTQQVFHKVYQLSKQINRTAVVPYYNHVAQSNYTSDRVIASVSNRREKDLLLMTENHRGPIAW